MKKQEIVTEKWKKIPGYGDCYVSDQARVQIHRTHAVDEKGNHRIVPGKVLKGSINPGGYVAVSLARRNSKTRKTWLVHRLVCLVFLDNPKNKPFVNHKNGVKDDNRLENLEWCTHAENMRHAHRLRKKLGIERKSRAVPPPPYVHEIGTPEEEYRRESAKLRITELHYKEKIKKGLIDSVPDSIIDWRKRFDALEIPEGCRW